MRTPEHIGLIPDGNRRWAVQRGFAKEQGYGRGIDPGLAVSRQSFQTSSVHSPHAKPSARAG
jgi:undecaprenyl pyrophosphate synthase